MRKTKIHETIKSWPFKLIVHEDPLKLAGEGSRDVVKALRLNGIDTAKMRSILIENYSDSEMSKELFLLGGATILNAGNPIHEGYSQAEDALLKILWLDVMRNHPDKPDIDMPALSKEKRKKIEQDIKHLKKHRIEMTKMSEHEALPKGGTSGMIGRQAYKLFKYFESLLHNTSFTDKDLHGLIADILNGIYKGNFTQQDIKNMTDNIFQHGKA
jgi:hypothetical protein